MKRNSVEEQLVLASEQPYLSGSLKSNRYVGRSVRFLNMRRSLAGAHEFNLIDPGTEMSI